MTDLPDNTQPDHIVDTHEMVTDTNQASEDIDNILFEAIESAGSYTNKLTADEADYIQEQAKEAILAIIRTEKLKLLAEVRERVVGDDDENYPYPESENIDVEGYNTLMGGRNLLRREQSLALAKLEAEL